MKRRIIQRIRKMATMNAVKPERDDSMCSFLSLVASLRKRSNIFEAFVL